MLFASSHGEGKREEGEGRRRSQGLNGVREHAGVKEKMKHARTTYSYMRRFFLSCIVTRMAPQADRKGSEGRRCGWGMGGRERRTCRAVGKVERWRAERGGFTIFCGGFGLDLGEMV